MQEYLVKMTDKFQIAIYVREAWRYIDIFEENEIKAWKSTNPLLTEARTAARMQAYIELIDKLL